MANLETLELTINGSAERAGQGIDTLISRLSALSDAITKPYSDLRDFNSALRETAKLAKGVSFKNIGKSVGASVTKAKAANGEYDPLTNNNRVAVNRGDPSAKPEVKWRQEYDANVRQSIADHQQRIKLTQEYRNSLKNQIELEKQAAAQRGKQAVAALTESSNLDLMHQKLAAMTNEYLQNVQAGKLTEKQTASQALQIKAYADQIEKLKNETNTSAKSVAKNVSGIGKSASNLFSSITRIFKTMLIRQAIRALLKGAKEGLDNYYQYSKKINNAFAASMDKTYKGWGQMKNQIGAALGSALNAVLPILNAVSSAALVALNAITALFALLGGQTTYSQATEGMNDYASAINKGGGAAKKWIATFDELNVMTQGGGGGGGGSAANFANMFKEMELPQWMIEWKPIIEALLAGTLGAIILPAIFSKIKDIIDLFTGGGASNLLTFLKYLFNPDGGTNNPVSLPDIPKDYKDFQFPQQPNYSPFPIQPSYQPFPAAPDYAAAASEMGLLAAGAVAAAPAVEKIVETLGKLKTGINVFEVLTTLLTTLVGNFLDGLTIKVDVNKEKFKEFKEEYEEWSKDKSISISFNTEDYLNYVKQRAAIQGWVDTVENKKIGLVIDTNDYILFSNQKTLINTWTDVPANKVIGAVINTNDYILLSNQMTMINTWINLAASKTIGLALRTDDYMLYLNQTRLIDLWVAAESAKTIGIALNLADYLQFNLTTAAIDLWIMNNASKRVGISINDDEYAAFLLQMAIVNEWAREVAVKIVNINVENDYDSMRLMMDWTDHADTKVIRVDVDDMSKINLIRDWVKTVDEKVIKVKVETEEITLNFNSGGNNTTNNNTFWDDFFGTLSLNTNQIINKLIGTNLPENGIIPDLINKLFPKSNKSTINVSEMVEIKNDPKFKTAVDLILTTTMNEVLSAGNIAALKKQFPGLKASDIVAITDFGKLSDTARKDFVTALVSAFGTSEAIAAIKKLIPNISAGGLISLTNWKSFSKEQQLSFITAIKDAFGAEAAKTAAKNAGINIGDLVKNGMNSKNADIKKQAESWSGLIDTGVKKTTPTVTPVLKKGVEGILSTTLKNGLEKTAATISNVTAKFKPGNPGNLKTQVEKDVKPSVSVTATTVKGLFEKLKKSIQENTQPSVTVNGTVKSGLYNTLKSAIEKNTSPNLQAGCSVKAGTYETLKKAFVTYASPNLQAGCSVRQGVYDNLKKALVAYASPNLQAGCSIAPGVYDNVRKNIEAKVKPDIKANISFENVRSSFLSSLGSFSSYLGNLFTGKLTFKAMGGFVDSGDLFVANENGVPEMIGRFGNQTAVANTDQIVAGISQGVADANAEQNALLREQNSLLRSILAKESTVNLGASSGLGRTVKQSLDMYAALTGG